MKLKDSWARIIDLDIAGKYIFSKSDLQVIFPEDSARGLQATLARLVEVGGLKRAVRGIYWNPKSRNLDRTTLERIAAAMRPGELCYLSLESILSAHSIISEQLMGTITVTTSGKGGWYTVDGLGAIDFAHTSKNPNTIMDNLLYDTHFLPHATARLAYAELKRAGRNVHLVDTELLEEIIDEQDAIRFSRTGRPGCPWHGTPTVAPRGGEGDTAL